MGYVNRITSKNSKNTDNPQPSSYRPMVDTNPLGWYRPRTQQGYANFIKVRTVRSTEKVQRLDESRFEKLSRVLMIA